MELRSLKKIVKPLLSIAMLGIVYYLVDWNKFQILISNISITYTVLTITLYCIGQLISSYKWWLILVKCNIQVTYFDTVRAYFLGMFVNCFGVGTIGGDLTRGIAVSLKDKSNTPDAKLKSVATVAADRIQGLTILALIGAVSCAIFRPVFLDYRLATSLILIGVCLAIGWFVGPALVKVLVPVNLKIFGKNVREKFSSLLEVFPREPSFLFKISVISLVFHLLQISFHLLMAKAVGADVPFSVLLVTIPFVNILGSLPISWNGLGVREAGYVFFLVPHALTTEQAVLFGGIWLAALTTASILGGIGSILIDDNSIKK